MMVSSLACVLHSYVIKNA
ncbi:hypothetical protein M8C21_015242, partial [Ambrosia artemisiifolia]